MKKIAIIPARMGSRRFPGKPMQKILGKPMIGHVYDQVNKAISLDLVVVATCDQEIYDYIESIGGIAVMTSNLHDRASDRCAEALITIEEERCTVYDIVIMVQGDEPMLHPDMINEVIEPVLMNENVQVVNLLGKITSLSEFNDPNCIKVVCDLNSDALYFSREPIPNQGTSDNVNMAKQVCVILFRRNFLIEYTNMSPTPLEVNESIDMMRILENGLKVKMNPTKYQSQAVDTPEDLRKVEQLMQAATKQEG
jgi:3-deoxy-manno-octulosonate cytidylyltransferase (CMP-KDO synthetase)